MESSMYKLCFYVPDSHLEAVKKAVFAIGAGRIGAYDSCCWQVLGQGQYRPLEGSQPFRANRAGATRAGVEVEMVVADELIHDSVKAMKKAHLRNAGLRRLASIGHAVLIRLPAGVAGRRLA